MSDETTIQQPRGPAGSALDPSGPTPERRPEPAAAVWPAASEHTRLYRAESAVRGEFSDWRKEALDASGHTEAEGRWFVADPAMLDWYKADIGANTVVAYVDVPTAELERYRISNSTEQIGRRPVRSYSRDPENEFFLPRDLADARKVLDGGRVPDAFDHVAENLRQYWYDEGLGSPRDSWVGLPAEDKIAYLADFAGANDVPYERFAATARKMLEMGPGQEFSADITQHLRRELDQSREWYARYRADQRRDRAQPNESRPDTTAPASGEPGGPSPDPAKRDGPAEQKTYDPTEFARGPAPKIKGKDVPEL
jgi:hypothetical protein